MKTRVIPIFVPHKGCPNDCIFCNQKKITGSLKEMKKEDIETTIEEYLQTMDGENTNIGVAFFGGSFTGIDFEQQKEFLGVAHRYKEEGRIDFIKLSTRPDYIDFKIINLLKENKVDEVELGVQSLNQEVLNKTNRGHTEESVYEAYKMLKEAKIRVGIQIMIGLYGDTEKRFLNTVKKVVDLKPDVARIYPTLVVKETELENLFNSGKYKSLELEKAVEMSAKALIMLEAAGINVIRVGLQPTDNITTGGDIVSGPFHPAFRQLVESEIYRWIIEEKIKNQTLENVIIRCYKKDVSNICGNKSLNLKILKEKYNIKSIKIKQENEEIDVIEIFSEDKKIASFNKNQELKKIAKEIEKSIS